MENALRQFQQNVERLHKGSTIVSQEKHNHLPTTKIVEGCPYCMKYGNILCRKIT